MNRYRSSAKNIIISGFAIDDSNRGTAALAYGSISFLQEKFGLITDIELIQIVVFRNIFKAKLHKDKIEIININGKQWRQRTIYVFWPFYQLAKRLHLLLPFTKIRRILNNTEYVAAINGGDGFSDIYGTSLFYYRLPDILLAMANDIPIILLPQTLGPFKDRSNYELARKILLKSDYIFVRDDKFIPELKRLGLKYELTRDLSYYMQPEPWGINIEEECIGLNVSGLAYSNRFKNLTGQFGEYKYILHKIVERFQSMNKTIYLISHSYRYNNPDPNNDDIEAARDFYGKLMNKTGVILIDKELNSPKTKYVISKMSFFIGTRMHANFAAIYTNVPVFGLAYSYKFKGAFDANGLNGNEQTAMINNITREQADTIVNKIINFYKKTNNGNK